MPSNSTSVLNLGAWTPLDWVNHLWQSTAVGLVILLLLALSGKLAARTRLALGWLALGKFALPIAVLVAAVKFVGEMPARWFASAPLAGSVGPVSVGLVSARAAAKPAMSLIVATPVSPSVLSAAAAFWIAGFALLFVSWLVRGAVARRRLLAGATPVSEAVAQQLAPAAKLAGLKKIPHCVAVDCEQGPALVGVFSPVVILPRELEEKLTPAEFRAVLLHEFIHLRCGDNLMGALRAFYVAVLWFNPVSWLLNRHLRADAEKACDERVLEITGDAEAYVGGIVKSVRHTLGLAAPGFAGVTTPPVVARIKNILAHDPRRKDRPLNLLAVMSGITLIGLSGYAGTLVAATPSLPEPAPVPVQGAPKAEPAPAPVSPVATPAPRTPPAEATLSVDFPEENIRQIIRNVADLFQINVITPATLQGKTTVKLRDVTWRQIFRIVLAPVGYTFVEEDKIVKIVPAERLTGSAFVAPVVLGSLSTRGPITPTSVSGSAGTLTLGGTGTLVLSGDPLSFGAGGTAPAVAPVPIGSLSARAAEARLIAQADELKAHAAKLQQDVEAYKAAQPDNAGAATDRETAVAAASLAALDARRQAAETAALATNSSAQMAGQEIERQAEIKRQRELSAADRAKQPSMISTEMISPRLPAPDQNRPAEGSAQSRPSVGEIVTPAVVDAVLAGPAKAASEEVHAHIVTYEPSQLDRQPVAVFQVRPQYPMAMRRAGIAGEATIDFVVDDNGQVINAYAIRSSVADFEPPAVRAVSQWKFRPGRKDGHNVTTHMQVPIVFTIEGK